MHLKLDEIEFSFICSNDFSTKNCGIGHNSIVLPSWCWIIWEWLLIHNLLMSYYFFQEVSKLIVAYVSTILPLCNAADMFISNTREYGFVWPFLLEVWGLFLLSLGLVGQEKYVFESRYILECPAWTGFLTTKFDIILYFFVIWSFLTRFLK